MRNTYNHQVILNLINDPNYQEDLNGMINYVKSKGSEPTVIDFSSSNPSLEKLNQLDKKSRLYIFAHGSVNHKTGEPLITEKRGPRNKEDTWSGKRLATLLEENLPDLKSQNTNQNLNTHRLVISLVVCFGAKSNDQQTIMKSFAGILQQQLAEKGIFVNVEARISITAMNKSQKKETIPTENAAEYLKLFIKHQSEPNSINITGMSPIEIGMLKNDLDLKVKKLNMFYKHQYPGSKISFRWSGEQQVAYEAYELKNHNAQYRNFKKAIKELEKYVLQTENVHFIVNANNFISNLEKKQTTSLMAPRKVTMQLQNSKGHVKKIY